MTELSYFWDGIVTGDAVEAAPDGYTQDQFASILNTILASDSPGYVIPGIDQAELDVTEQIPAAMGVQVNAGAAIVAGFSYISDDKEQLTIAANASGNPRIDRIILRVDWAAKEIRLAVLQGTAAATPVPETLTQSFGATWEISLAYVWVANGATQIDDEEIHDERLFLPTYEASLEQVLQENLIFNSEYMGWSGLELSPVERPEGWGEAGSPTYASSAKPSNMIRGRAVEITAGASDSGISQSFPIAADARYVLKVLVNVTAGDVGRIQILTDGGTPTSITRYVRRTGSYIDEYIYFTTPVDATELTVRLWALNNNDVVSYGQALLIPGRIPGPYRPFHETISFDRAGLEIYDVDGESTGNNTVTIPTVDVNGVIADGTKAIIVNMSARWTAGTTDWVGIEVSTIANQCLRPRVVATDNAGSVADQADAAEFILPYRTQDVVFNVSGSTSPVNFDTFKVFIVGVIT